MRTVPTHLVTFVALLGLISTESVAPPVPTVEAVSSHDDLVRARRSEPDHVADYVGGIAARLRTLDGIPVPGDLFFLMAIAGSDAPARLFTDTIYAHGRETTAETLDSNRFAAETASAITGIDIEPLELTSAPGGGPSGGLLYLIAYLDIISDGAFTGDLRIAATGRLDAEGYIGHVDAVAEKLGAARLADADVVFAPYAPARVVVDEHTERQVGRGARSRLGRLTLHEERQLVDYEAFGASAADGLDFVVVGHIADVAAYLCGAGSRFACTIAERLGKVVTSDEVISFDDVRAAPAQHDERSQDPGAGHH